MSIIILQTLLIASDTQPMSDRMIPNKVVYDNHNGFIKQDNIHFDDAEDSIIKVSWGHSIAFKIFETHHVSTIKSVSRHTIIF